MSWGDPLWTFYWWHVSLHRSECCSEAVLVSSFSLSQKVIGLLGATGPITISSRLCWSQSHCFSQASSLIPPPYLHLSLSFKKRFTFHLCVNVCAHVCECLWRPEEARCPETEILDRCEPQNLGPGNWTLQEQKTFLTAEPPFQAPFFFFLFLMGSPNFKNCTPLPSIIP